MEVQSKRMNYCIFRGIIIAINTNTGFFPIATYNSINVIGGEAIQMAFTKKNKLIQSTKSIKCCVYTIPFHRWQKGKRKNGDEVTEVGKY